MSPPTSCSASICNPVNDDLSHTDENENVSLSMPPPEDPDHHLLARCGVSPPPPHLVDRFYRPSQARRKGSAASSRRNSLSSAHSFCSSLGLSRHAQSHPHPNPHSHTDGDPPQSKYVAQHLRRVSFLADRKARLADRAAHVEKVRLRAALAKASHRDPSLSHERALAAQQARDRNLAEIASACAEEVKHAKAVAELIRERHQSKMAKMRTQIEERMLEAERRREQLLSRSAQRRHRATSSPPRCPPLFDPCLPRLPEHALPAPAPSLTPSIAATKIQRCWRTALRRRILQHFSALGLTIDSVSVSSFDDVTVLLAQDRVLLATAQLLRICGLADGPSRSVQDMIVVRTFLSAYLILGHPTSVLSNSLKRSEQEQDVVNKARDLLICFDSVLSHLTVLNRYLLPTSMTSFLPKAYATFHDAFVAWKSRDSNALVDMMLLQFVELDAIWQSVKQSGDKVAEEHYLHTLKEAQVTLIVRIRRLTGDKSRKLIADAMRDSRAARAARKPASASTLTTTDMTPRAASSLESHRPDICLSSPSPSSPPEPVSTAGTAAPLPAPASIPTILASPDSSSSPAPPAPLAVESDALATGTVSSQLLYPLLPNNRLMMHELAVDNEYVVPVEDFRAHHALLLKPFFAGFSVTDASAFEAGPVAHENFSRFLFLSRCIKEKLQRLVRQGTHLHSLIGEILDPEVARRQYSVGSFSYEKYFLAIAAILPQMCAPFRDDEVRDLVQVRLRDGDLVYRAQALVGFIDTMLCDYVNHLLRQSAPGLIDNAASYEANAFAHDVATRDRNRDHISDHIGDHNGIAPSPTFLPSAEAAWRAARTKVLADNGLGSFDQGSGEQPQQQPQPAPPLLLTTTRGRLGDKIYAQMLVDVFTQSLPAPMADIPEMLRMDTARLARLSIAVRRIVVAGAVLLQCKNLLKRDVRSPWKTEAAHIMAVLDAAPPDAAPADADAAATDGIMAALETGRAMPAATRAHLRALVAKVVAAARDPDPRDPVLRLLLHRLRSNIAARLATAASASDHVREAGGAGDRLARLGLAEFADHVRAVAAELARIGKADRAAHAYWWEHVAHNVDLTPSS